MSIRYMISIDPGAERLGWCSWKVVDLKPVYQESGHLSCPREDGEAYQEYAQRVIDHYTYQAGRLLNWHTPSVVVNEYVPPVGGNASNQIQRQLATIALTAFQTVAIHSRPTELAGVGATTIKKNIGGAKKATKVQVRNGVISLLPELADRKSDWTKIFEEPDAIATGLTWFGLKAVNG